MSLVIEKPDEIDDFEREDTFSNELLDVTAAIESNGKATRLETVALLVTMKQINAKYEIPAHEQMSGPCINTVALATEALKENVSAKWTKFVDAIKSMYRRLRDYIKKTVRRLREKIRNTFKGSGKQGASGKGTSEGGKEQPKQESKSESSSTAEKKEPEKAPEVRAEETPDDVEPEQVKGEVAVPDKEVIKVRKCFIDMGSEANIETLAERLKYEVKLANFTLKMVVQHSFDTLANGMLSSVSGWENESQSLVQNVLEEFMDGLGATVRFDVAIAKISETFSIKMPLEDHNSYLMYDLSGDEEIELDQPEDIEGYKNLISPTMGELFDILGKMEELGDKAENEFKVLTSTDNEELRNRVVSISPVLQKRITFIVNTIRLIKETTTAAVRLVEG